MSTTAPSCIAATGAGLASTGIGAASGASGSAGAGSVTDVDLAELVRRSEQANAALMRGDALTIPGFQNRMTAFAVRLLPRRAVVRLVRSAQERTG